MSAKFPMVSLDKCEVKITSKVETVVKVDKVAACAGLSRAAVINGYIEDGLKKANIRLTLEDLKRVQEIKSRNIANREAKKAKKGMR